MKKICADIYASKTVFLFLVFLLIASTTCLAQPPDIGGDVDTAPVDGGLSLLVAAGVGYAAKRISGKKKQPVQ